VLALTDVNSKYECECYSTIPHYCDFLCFLIDNSTTSYLSITEFLLLLTYGDGYIQQRGTIHMKWK
jgi:hypothetical protein